MCIRDRYRARTRSSSPAHRRQNRPPGTAICQRGGGVPTRWCARQGAPLVPGDNGPEPAGIGCTPRWYAAPPHPAPLSAGGGALFWGKAGAHVLIYAFSIFILAQLFPPVNRHLSAWQAAFRRKKARLLEGTSAPCARLCALTATCS